MYFSTFIIFGVWFLFELLAGVLFSNFLINQQKAKHSFLTEDQVKWIEIQSDILNSNEYLFIYPKAGIKVFLFKILKSKIFIKLIKFTLFSHLILLIAISELKTSTKMSKYYEIFCNFILLIVKK